MVDICFEKLATGSRRHTSEIRDNRRNPRQIFGRNIDGNQHKNNRDITIYVTTLMIWAQLQWLQNKIQ